MNDETKATAMQKTRKPAFEGKLTDGRSFQVFEGKGNDAKIAMRMANGDEGSYMPALMARLVTIENEAIFPDMLDEMALRDYLAIQAEFNRVNVPL